MHLDIFWQSYRIAYSNRTTDERLWRTDCADAFARLTGGSDVCLSCHPRVLSHYIHTHFRLVKAAGGIVRRADGLLLMIRREGQWDLPKGVVEPHERIRDAALREVAEETGVVAETSSNRPVFKTYHIFNKYGGWHFKQTSWYMMRQQGAANLVPQVSEGISEACWVPYELWRRRLEGSYAGLAHLSANIQL